MRNLPFFIKLILFLVSYVPLFVIFLIIDFSSWEYPFFEHGINSFVAILSVIILCVFSISVFRFFEHKGKAGNEVVKMSVKSAKPLDKEVLSYIVTYMIPFLSLPEKNKFAVEMFMMAVICTLYINSNMLGINPLLNVLGYSIFEVIDTDDKYHVVVARGSKKQALLRGKQISHVSMSGDLEMLVEVLA